MSRSRKRGGSLEMSYYYNFYLGQRNKETGIYTYL